MGHRIQVSDGAGSSSIKPRHTNLGWAAPLGLLILVIFYLFETIPLQQTIRNYAFDLYQNITPRERVSAPVVIVDIDEASLERFGQWPWPRSLMAQLLNKVGEYEPAAIALDIIMPEKDRSSPCEMTKLIPGVDPNVRQTICELPSNDELLASALQKHHAILGIAGIQDSKPTKLRAPPMLAIGGNPLPHMKHFNAALTNLDELQQAAAGQAILSTEVERGVIRRVPLVASVGDTALPALSLETLRMATKQATFKIFSNENGIEAVGISDLVIPTQSDGTLYVHYSPHDPARFVSASAILNDEVSIEQLAQRLVLIGFSGLGLVDFPTTALGERVPGVEIHAQVLETIFDGTTLIRPFWAKWLEATLMIIMGLFVLLILPNLRAAFQVTITATTLAIINAVGYIAYVQFYILLDIAFPILLFAVLYIAMLGDSLIRDEGQIENLEDDLRLQREEAAKVQGEMEAAKRFQMGILPDANTAFTDDKRIDIAALMEPAKMVGGDLYDFFRLDKDHIFFSLGDVCGKGVPASLFMVISKTLCKSVALRENADYGELGKIISQANREISRDNPEMLFVTAFMGIINLTTGELIFCNAGHERPLIVAPNCKTRELTESSGPPISVMDEMDYETFTYRLSDQEFICVFTDGITEAANNEQVLYGNERLLNAVEDIDKNDTAGVVLNKIHTSVQKFVADEEPSDDLTMLVIRWCGNS